MKVGDSLYVACYPYDRVLGFYVRATIVEIDEVWGWVSDPRKPTVWATSSDDNPNRVYSCDGKEVSEKEFNDLVAQNKITKANVFPWVDWPLGHAAYLGSDGFLTLEDARRKHGRFSRKHLGRRMEKYLSQMLTFIEGTYKLAGHNVENFPWDKRDIPRRKGYV